MFKLLIILSLLLSAISCGKKNHSSSSELDVHEDPIHSRPLEITQRESVTFVRQKQMVSRYNCNGLLTSRKMETQNSLSKKITIKYENRKKAYQYSAYNRRTKSSAKGFLADNGNLVIDYAPTVFNMYVKEGINDIEYTFSRCKELGKDPKGQPICLKLELEKEGILQIDVTYSSVEIPSEQHIHPLAESCKAKL